jgi:iron complex outermembrane receptor protein
MKKSLFIILVSLFSLGHQTLLSNEIEEIVVTGTLLKNIESDSSPVEQITNEDFDNLNVNNIAEISKYLNTTSGSHFQTNALEGVDQGMANITLRGLDHASTLLLINSKRHTFAGTPSNEGEGYIDANIIPEIAFEKIEILKEGATSIYGSDAVAGVVNFLTYKKFDGFKIKFGDQSSENYNNKETTFGLIFGAELLGFDMVFGFNQLDRAPLSAAEIPGIAELALSSLGNTFLVSEADVIDTGAYAGSYTAGEIVPDPNCELNGGVLDGFCKFLYGTRFNIFNDENHSKYYLNLTNNNHNLTFINSNVLVTDNPQSPSYPALPFLSRSINPGEGGSPFSVPVKWYGRPLGARYPSPFSPKDIAQMHLNYTYLTAFNGFDLDFSLTISEHSNNHTRPDIIDSRFQDALIGQGGPNGDQTWNIFIPTENSAELVDYVRGAEISSKVADLTAIDVLASSSLEDFEYVFGLQLNNENLDIKYNDLARAEFDQDGKITKTADLFFLGGGKNVGESRNKYAAFFEGEKEFFGTLDLRVAARYESSDNFTSIDPKVSLKYKPTNSFAFRLSQGTSFAMPSMAQMFSSDINLGSVRDQDENIFVRQARIGNPDLKPATAVNSNFGLIFNTDFNRLSLDYWEITYENRVVAQSAQALLQLDSFGPSITRNSEGDLIAVTTTYFNEKNTELSGVDLGYEHYFDLNSNGRMKLNLKATSFIEFLTPGSASDVLVNRVGKFNFDSNTNSLPKNRINAFLNWKLREYETGLNARYISGYLNDRTIPESAKNLGYSNKVDSHLVFDLSFKTPIGVLFNNVSLEGKFAIVNLFDKSAPRLYDAPDFSFDTRTHDPRGRMLSIQFELGLLD